jgi:hypothetical protein
MAFDKQVTPILALCIAYDAPVVYIHAPVLQVRHERMTIVGHPPLEVFDFCWRFQTPLPHVVLMKY